ncbi:MAG: hypothetical protein M3Z16_00605 [Pseudomonadota bacterium]|nr:hypothetical protein [Pseudomonadota bacterium]
MVSPVLLKTTGGRKLMWTVDDNVGLGQPNKQADVDLVQLGYAYMLANAQAQKSADEVAAFKKVKPGDMCNGRADDPLVQAIVAHQKSRGGTQDGRVSKFSESHATYGSTDGPHTHMGVALVFNIMAGMLDDYPRLDKSKTPPCPPSLKAAVLQLCQRDT